MKTLITTLATLALVPAAYAAEMNHMDNMPMDHQGMKNMPMQQEQVAQTASATGTVKKVNAEQGTLTIAHGPVPELQWPAMVMPFEASAEQIGQVKEGDEIAFDFTAEGMKYRITSLEKR